MTFPQGKNRESLNRFLMNFQFWALKQLTLTGVDYANFLPLIQRGFRSSKVS